MRLDWNGDAAQPLSDYPADIATLRAMGGDVIPSFGGFSADQGGTEIADSCTHVSQIAADYESVITHARRHPAGHGRRGQVAEQHRRHHRRNKAIAMTEAWAAARASRCRSSTRSRWSSTA